DLVQGLSTGAEYAGDLRILAHEMPKADTARRRRAQRHQAREPDALLGDLADHDALQLGRLRIPEQIDRVLAIGVFLARRVVRDRLAAGEGADDTEAVDPAGKARDADVLLRMNAAARRIDDREPLCFAVALLDQIDRLLHVDDVRDLLGPEQQNVVVLATH